MTERAYTVAEIDAMRAAIQNKYIWGFYGGNQARARVTGDNYAMSRSYNEVTMAKVVEEQIRTYMLAGRTAEDLYASERE